MEILETIEKHRKRDFAELDQENLQFLKDFYRQKSNVSTMRLILNFHVQNLKEEINGNKKEILTETDKDKPNL